MLANLPKAVKGLALVILLGFSANAILSPFWVVYAIDNIGLSPVDWGTILLVETGLRTLLYVPAGILVDRYGRTRSLFASLLLLLGSIPLFAFSRGFMEVLFIRMAIAVNNAFFIPACSALMADTVPRDMRGRVMAAMGRGTVMMGAPGGGTGGPGVGYLITIPLILSSIAGGYIYALDPSYPWILVSVSILLSLFITALYIRDPKKAAI